MLLHPRRTFLLLTSSIFLILLTRLPFHTAIAEEAANSAAAEQDFEDLGLHYGKYLKEVVAALDKDQKFTETIKNMNADDIKSGKVAEQLKHVNEDVRKKLNELKYLEIKRLRDLATRKNEVEQYGETYHGTDKRKWRTLGASLSQIPDHLGSHSTYFDTHDLHKLMVSATNDLEKIDKERRQDFKTYEMEKEWQFQERIKMMNETEKAEAIKERQKLKEKHDDHPKVHEPGTKEQFQEVWEKKDHLPKAEFDPKTFFTMHDTNSDNFWDAMEVKQLLDIEIRKIYDPNNPEDDPNEMEEEYERMREHVYKEIDADKDQLISMKEFLDYAKSSEFKQDNGWEDNGKRAVYSKDDYEDYTKNRARMLRESHGHYDPAYYANQPANMHLPNWGLGMPANVDPSQYYGYHIDPNHPQAQQMMAQQQQMAYHQAAAYQQQAAYHQQAAGAMPQQVYQQHPQVNQQYYQQAPVQTNQQYQQKPQIAQQPPAQQPPMTYQQPQQMNAPAAQQPLGQQQAIPQQQTQQQPIPQQQPQQPVQTNYQQPQQTNYQQPPVQQQQPQMQQQQAIPQQQQPIAQQQAVPQQQQQQQQVPHR